MHKKSSKNEEKFNKKQAPGHRCPGAVARDPSPPVQAATRPVCARLAGLRGTPRPRSSAAYSLAVKVQLLLQFVSDRVYTPAFLPLLS
jgi:hypothetical protein